MDQTNKQKLLGQFYSGNKIAKTLFELLGSPNNISVIDPMCGKGDLLKPFCQYNNDVFGVELDNTAYNEAIEYLTPNTTIINGNSFSNESLDLLKLRGYNVVITNPPYIRRENYSVALDVVKGTLPITCIKDNLLSFCSKVNTINKQQRSFIKETISSLSSKSDIAAFSWILCMLLVKNNGMLAIVAPNTWIGREYSLPIVKILDSLFEIQYIINDTNSCWFKGSAQIQTSLIIAKRTNSISKNHMFYYIDLYASAINKDSLTAFVQPNHTFTEFIKAKTSIKNCCEIQEVLQHEFCSEHNALPPTSMLLSLPLTNQSFLCFEDMGIICGQGFRSGANAFFILKSNKNYYISNLDSIRINKDARFFIPIIQNQNDLPKTINVISSENLSVLLAIPYDYAIQADLDDVPPIISDSFKKLPFDIETYITVASKKYIGGKTIPNLSAVKTNVKSKGVYRFWYHLPQFTNRHISKVFIPRVNGSYVIGRHNPNQYIVDANFISLWSNSLRFTNEGILALTNSTWFRILCEENGIVMGGGALKIDSVQVKKFLFPAFTSNHINKINILGEELSKASLVESQAITKKIDFVFLSALGIDKNCSIVQNNMSLILNDYLSRRK